VEYGKERTIVKVEVPHRRHYGIGQPGSKFIIWLYTTQKTCVGWGFLLQSRFMFLLTASTVQLSHVKQPS